MNWINIIQLAIIIYVDDNVNINCKQKKFIFFYFLNLYNKESF